MRTWTGAHKWEEVRRIGGGGQSEVFLVRNSKRIQEREEYLAKLRELAGPSFSEGGAQDFAEAILGYGREERPSELGALKAYKPHATEQQGLKRLRVEIEVLRKGRPGLVTLLDSNESERWIVTEFYPGGTIEGSLSSFAGNVLLSLTAFRHLVETVATLHKDGVVHRDIKPANVFLNANKIPILGDFGIALPPNPRERITLTDESVGPWHYRPPWADMAGRLEDVDGSFDVYMLGKLLWCMVAGRLKLLREYYRRADYDVTRLFPSDPHMHAINAILDKCLRDKPEECLPSASELLVVVNSHLRAIQGGGQMLREGVPRPCRVCGTGFYRPHDSPSRFPGTAAILQWVTPNERGRYAQPYTDQGSVLAKLFICDTCGHVQLFKS